MHDHRGVTLFYAWRVREHQLWQGSLGVDPWEACPPISSLNAEDVDCDVLLGAQFGTAILLDLYARSALIHNLNLNIDIHCLHLFISLSIYTSYSDRVLLAVVQFLPERILAHF